MTKTRERAAMPALFYCDIAYEVIKIQKDLELSEIIPIFAPILDRKTNEQKE